MTAGHVVLFRGRDQPHHRMSRLVPRGSGRWIASRLRIHARQEPDMARTTPFRAAEPEITSVPVWWRGLAEIPCSCESVDSTLVMGH